MPYNFAIVGFLFGSPSMLKKSLAWCAHLYTAFGLIAAAGIAVTIYYGDFYYAFVLMFLAVVVDATDGTFARAVKVKEVLPHFDGRRLDDLIDFHTYATLPLFLIWRANLLPHEWQGILIAPLLASVYGCQTNAKTGDGYFLGFPSHWNSRVLFVCAGAGVADVVAIAVLRLTFLPMRYLSIRPRSTQCWTNVLKRSGRALDFGVVRFPESRSDGAQRRSAEFCWRRFRWRSGLYKLSIVYHRGRLSRRQRQHRI